MSPLYVALPLTALVSIEAKEGQPYSHLSKCQDYRLHAGAGSHDVLNWPLKLHLGEDIYYKSTLSLI